MKPTPVNSQWPKLTLIERWVIACILIIPVMVIWHASCASTWQ